MFIFQFQMINYNVYKITKDKARASCLEQKNCELGESGLSELTLKFHNIKKYSSCSKNHRA